MANNIFEFLGLLLAIILVLSPVLFIYMLRHLYKRHLVHKENRLVSWSEIATKQEQQSDAFITISVWCLLLIYIPVQMYETFMVWQRLNDNRNYKEVVVGLSYSCNSFEWIIGSTYDEIASRFTKQHFKIPYYNVVCYKGKYGLFGRNWWNDDLMKIYVHSPIFSSEKGRIVHTEYIN